MLKRITILFFLLMIFIVGIPAEAAPKVSFNGAEAIDVTGSKLFDGHLLFPVKYLSDYFGADCEWNNINKQLSFQKNGHTGVFIPGETRYTRDGQVTDMECPAQIISESLYVPLRPVADIIGAEISYNAETNVVNISYNEKRSGMTVEEYLNASAVSAAKNGTCAIKGNINGKVSSGADGTDKEEFQIAAIIDGKIDNKKLAYYLILDMTGKETGQEDDNIRGEILIKGNKMYSRLAGEEWIEEEELPPEALDLMKQLTDPSFIQANYSESLSQYGIHAVFGNDIVRNGKKNTVIKILLNKDQFLNAVKTILTESDNYYSEDIAMMDGFISMVDMNLGYEMYIDSDTMLTELVKFQSTAGINDPAFSIAIEFDGNMSFTDYGEKMLMPNPR